MELPYRGSLWNWSYGRNLRCLLGFKYKAALVVTDAGLADSNIIKELIEVIEESNLEVGLFSKVQGNPVGANIEEGTTAFRSGSHDGVIAIGGGSAMDAGKVIAMYQGRKVAL